MLLGFQKSQGFVKNAEREPGRSIPEIPINQPIVYILVLNSAYSMLEKILCAKMKAERITARIGSSTLAVHFSGIG